MEKTKRRAGAFLSGNMILFLLILLVAIFGFTVNNFFTTRNLTNIFFQSSWSLIVGCGVALIMISGNVDLSIGYQVSLLNALIGVMSKDLGWSPALIILMTFAGGAVFGLFNGVMVVKFKMFPLLSTLATASVFQGISYLVSNSHTYINLPKALLFWGETYVAGIPICIFLMIACVIFISLVLKYTFFGRYIYGAGGNAEAMKLAGVNVDAVKLIVYVAAGLFLALGTLMQIARAGSASSNMGVGVESTLLSAGILGGISFRGGAGKVSGMVMGVLFMQVLANGMQLMGMNSNAQYIVQGAVLLLAVGFDTWNKEKKTKMKKLRKYAEAETPKSADVSR